MSNNNKTAAGGFGGVCTSCGATAEDKYRGKWLCQDCMEEELNGEYDVSMRKKGKEARMPRLRRERD